MGNYRFYLVEAEGKFKTSSDFQFDDDLAALEHATSMLKADPIEAWQGTRLVFVIKPDGTSAF